MSNRLTLAIAAALIIAPLTAHAADYRVMGEDERAISLIEAGIKTDSEGHRETVFFIGFSAPVSGPGSTQVISSTILFDCAGARYKVGASSTFTAEMAPIQRGTVQYSWRDIVPDSPFSRAGAYACKGVALPKADAGEVKTIVTRYLARRAAAAVVETPPVEATPAETPAETPSETPSETPAEAPAAAPAMETPPPEPSPES